MQNFFQLQRLTNIEGDLRKEPGAFVLLVENFFCLTGRFEISWGDQGQHKLILEPNDMISIPRGENRMFFNISDEIGRLLVMIVPETDQQIDPITYAPSLGKEIENEWLLITSGVLSVLFGVIILMYPGAGALGLAFGIGMFAVLYGLLLVGFALRLRKHAEIKI